MIPQFHGTIKDGRFTRNREEVFGAYCQSLSDGDYYEELHKSKGASKTLAQLAYYYAVIIPMTYQSMLEHGNDSIVVPVGNRLREVPLTKEVVDDLLKEACLKKDDEKSKAKMSIEEASEFIDKCIMWCAKFLGCVIPEPKKSFDQFAKENPVEED